MSPSALIPLEKLDGVAITADTMSVPEVIIFNSVPEARGGMTPGSSDVTLAIPVGYSPYSGSTPSISRAKSNMNAYCWASSSKSASYENVVPAAIVPPL